MSDIWTPKQGDIVKLTVSKTWGPSKGVPINIRLTEVAEVSKAGYVKVRGRRTSKFERKTGSLFSEWYSKAHGIGDYRVVLEPATPEEVASLPNNDTDGRAYAQAKRPQQETV